MKNYRKPVCATQFKVSSSHSSIHSTPFNEMQDELAELQQSIGELVNEGILLREISEDKGTIRYVSAPDHDPAKAT